MYYLDDLSEGLTFELGSISLSKADMLDFSSKFDPQTFHLDDEVGTKMFGGIIASGWHTVSLGQRLLVDGFLTKVVCLASPGVDNLRFLHPVYADDVLTGKAVVQEARASRSKPERGIAKLLIELTNSNGKPVLSMVGNVMVARRPGQ